VICDRCGVELEVGLWPWCPHERGRFGFEPLTPYFDRDLVPGGVQVNSRTERAEIMKRNRVRFRDSRDDF